MSMETVRVTPGILPPTIRTTPNSPMVCANAKTTPAISPGTERGTTTRKKVRAGEAPSVAEAASSLRSTEENAAVKGCTANGRLYRTEPITNPANVKGSAGPVKDGPQRPSGLCEPRATSTYNPSTVGGNTIGKAMIA